MMHLHRKQKCFLHSLPGMYTDAQVKAIFVCFEQLFMAKRRKQDKASATAGNVSVHPLPSLLCGMEYIEAKVEFFEMILKIHDSFTWNRSYEKPHSD